MSRDDASAPPPKEHAVLQTMALLATLSTAEDVRTAIAERRAGRDPSAQEPQPVAVSYLSTAAPALQELLMQLLLSHVNLRFDHDEALALAVRHFDERMKLRRIVRLLQGMHQRLLSLYPTVSEELVEEARLVHRDAEALLDSDVEPFIDQLGAVLERGLSLAAWTEHELPV
ncbi:MAG: hypothetical protein GVY35_03785 [Bacteroidetes bacterium]|nr:hypothetical protein [Bacteroidota bacterium]